jgi:putative effector of murein hydrolase LrgA (UPF0299 family)
MELVISLSAIMFALIVLSREEEEPVRSVMRNLVLFLIPVLVVGAAATESFSEAFTNIGLQVSVAFIMFYFYFVIYRLVMKPWLEKRRLSQSEKPWGD